MKEIEQKKLALLNFKRTQTYLTQKTNQPITEAKNILYE